MSEDHSHNESKSKPKYLMTLLLLCIGFSVPLGLWFSVVYDSEGGFGNSMLIYLGAYIIGFIATLLYYRMAVQDDTEAKIDKISKSKVSSIAGSTFAAFLVLLITVVILAINPDLITIFENSIGIWVIGILGYSDFINEIFKSSIFGKLRESSDATIFNQNFLLTQFNEKNIEEFVKFFKETIPPWLFWTISLWMSRPMSSSPSWAPRAAANRRCSILLADCWNPLRVKCALTAKPSADPAGIAASFFNPTAFSSGSP